MTDLLPCPFCGGEAFRDSSAVCTGTPMVGCMGCSAHVVAGTQVGAEDAWNCRALPAASQPEAEPVAFQQRVHPWMLTCFGAEISDDRLERGDRLLEEVFELLQSGDYPKDRVAALTGYVWSRPAGEPAQEVGGVMVTLAAYCLAHGLDMHEAAETELARIWTKVDKIRAKQKAKPTGSALPQEWATPAPAVPADDHRQSIIDYVRTFTPDALPSNSEMGFDVSPYINPRIDPLDQEDVAHWYTASPSLLRSQQPAAPVSGVTVKPGIIERAVWSAMIWAASNNAGFDGVPEYTDRGNSFAEDEARRAAARIRSALEGK